MRFYELTMPLDWEWMPDEAFATSAKFVLGRPGEDNKGLTLGNETGTCLLLPSQFLEFRSQTRVHEIDIESLVLRPTRVVSVSAGPQAALTEEMLRPAVEASNFSNGEALLIRTGWGDDAGRFRGSDRYLLESPYLTDGGAKYLVNVMDDRSSELLIMDTALVGRPSDHLIPEWAMLNPRPAPYPSPEARGYLRGYRGDRVTEDFKVEFTLAGRGKVIVKKIVDAGDLPEGLVDIIVAPLMLVRGIGATCRVVAVSEPNAKD